jgi:ferredoxin
MIKKSTRAFWKMQGEGARGIRRIVNMIHGYIYYTLYDRYISFALSLVRFLTTCFPRASITRSFFNFFTQRYHAKVVTFEDVAKLIRLDTPIDVPPEGGKRIIPYDIANRLIFNHRDQIAVVDCPCRLEKKNRKKPYCEPIGTCIFLGKVGVDFVTTHMPRMHGRRITVDEATTILSEQQKNGVSFTLWFKDATGYRGGVLCSCCRCCCGGAEVERIMYHIPGANTQRITAPSGFSAHRTEGLCTFCGDCVSACPYGALTGEVQGKSYEIVYSYERCMGCGACESVCEVGAIRLVRDTKKGDVLDVDSLAERYG